MPVHNALPYLDAAVESILRQTVADFEFVILDDASTDGSTERLREWSGRDLRIRLIELEEKQGPARSSEAVARQARAPIVARMDADDISHPERLARQLDLLDRHPQAGLVASLSKLIDARGRVIRGPELWRLARRSPMAPFAHDAIMYRRELFEQAGGYRPDCDYWEDQDLVTRMAGLAKVLVIRAPLLEVRQSATSTRSSSSQDRIERSLDRMYRSIDGAEPGRGDRLDPRVFLATGSVTLWGGGHPRLFRRVLRRARLGLDLRSAAIVLWTGWASVSPQSLRLFLAALLAVRNRAAASRLGAFDHVEWKPR